MTDCTPPGLLSVAEANARIQATIEPVAGFEQLPLGAALDRVLLDPVRSPINVPGHRNSAMDGYAIRCADLATDGESAFTVIGRSLAGEPYPNPIAAGQAVRIMTGAVVPEEADCVVMQEQTRREGDTVFITAGHRVDENIRHPGDDIVEGSVVLTAGRRLTPADIGLLASLGVPEVRVRRRLRAAIFSTGDELAPLGAPLAQGQIYDSNRYTLAAMLHRLGIEAIDMGVVRDRPEAIAEAFGTAAAVADVVITSGGVSVGEADFVKATLDALGEVAFWKIAMKPGKPLAFGHLGTTAFFGLPGNPVSVMATFYQVVQPALRRMIGETVGESLRFTAQLTAPLKKRPGRQDFQRGTLQSAEDGTLRVSSTGNQGSHVLSSMSRANCFIILPAESGDVAAGEWVEVQPFAVLT